MAPRGTASGVADPSHLIALQIERAQDVAGLKLCAVQMDALVLLLRGSGSRIEHISQIVCERHRQLFARLWGLLAPAELVANSCLLVMGSEGRGEQILKTDQDNALLLRDGVEFPGLQELTARFSAALIDFGYPPCPGHIMLSEPLWCQPLAAFKETLRGWMFGGEADGAMNLAVFVDAAAVAGDAALLHEARRFIDEHLVDNDAFFARFANAADQFDDGAGWWAKLVHLAHLAGRSDDAEAQAFDLKKLSSFPVVHGVRALALQHHVAALGTAARLQVLAQRHLLPAATAHDLTEALHFLMALKLDNHLRQRRAGQPVSNRVQLAALGTHEREGLKDALAVIKRFRQHLRVHFRLDAL